MNLESQNGNHEMLALFFVLFLILQPHACSNMVEHFHD